jgi:hypothetical protein
MARLFSKKVMATYTLFEKEVGGEGGSPSGKK